MLLVKVTAPPVDSAANAAVIELLAKNLKVPKRDIAIVGGEASRNKRVRVAGLAASDIRARLAQ